MIHLTELRNWEFLQKHRRVAMWTAIFVAAWMLVYCLFIYQEKYKAESLVLIKDSAVTSRYLGPDQNYAVQTTSSSASNPVLNTMGLLRSESVSTALYEYLRKNYPQSLKKHGIKNIDGWISFYGDGKRFLKAKNIPATDLIALQFSWDDKVIAKDGLSAIVSAFQTTSRNINRAEQVNRSIYLTKQIEDLQRRLQMFRNHKSLYKQNEQTINLGNESQQLSAEQIKLSSTLNDILAQARGKEAEYKRYQSMLKLTPESGLAAAALGMNGSMSQLQDKLYKLNQQHAEMKSTMTDKNPKVQQVAAQIEAVKRDIAAEAGRTLGTSNVRGVMVADTNRSTLINSMAAARADSIRYYTQAETIRSRLGDLNTAIKAFPDKEAHLANIEEEEKSMSSALDTLRQKLLEAELKQAETLSNVFIIDTPLKPFAASFPNRFQMLILGFGFALACGVAAAWVKEWSLTKLDPAVLEKLETVPAMIQSRMPKQLFHKKPVYDAPISPFARTVAENEPVSAATLLAEPAPVETEPVPVVASVMMTEPLMKHEGAVETHSMFSYPSTQGSPYLTPITPPAASLNISPAIVAQDVEEALLDEEDDSDLMDEDLLEETVETNEVVAEDVSTDTDISWADSMFTTFEEDIPPEPPKKVVVRNGSINTGGGLKKRMFDALCASKSKTPAA